MESINIILFNALNAGAAPDGFSLVIATVLAEYLVGVVPLLLIFLWFRDRSAPARTRLLQSFFSALLALGINQLIGLFYQHPRPFMAGIGHTFLHHVADSSFPSDHVTVISAVGIALLLDRTTRRAGVFLLLTALPVAWARIYLGVHFPLDMVGALGMALLAVSIIRFAAHHVDRLASQPLLRIYARLIPPSLSVCSTSDNGEGN